MGTNIGNTTKIRGGGTYNNAGNQGYGNGDNTLLGGGGNGGYDGTTPIPATNGLANTGGGGGGGSKEMVPEMGTNIGNTTKNLRLL